MKFCTDVTSFGFFAGTLALRHCGLFSFDGTQWATFLANELSLCPILPSSSLPVPACFNGHVWTARVAVLDPCN